VLSLLAVGQQSRLLLLADFLFLAAVGTLSAVVVGAQVGWILPAGIALVFSTPGLVSLKFNILSRADCADIVMYSSIVMWLLAGILFVIYDDYGLVGARLRTRISGVTDE
jgi:hypothetical protein